MSRSTGSAPVVAEIFRAYWRSNGRMLVLVAGVVLVSRIAGIAAPYLFSRLIDWLGQGMARETVILGILACGLLAGTASALQRMVSSFAFMSAENLSFIASTRFFDQIIRKTPSFFIEHNPAQIQDAGRKGRDGLAILVQLGLIVFVPGLVEITLALLAIGAKIDLLVMGIVLAYGAFFIALSWFASRRTKPFLDAAIAGDQENARLVGNAVQAMETLRHFGAADWMGARFRAQAQTIRDNWRAYCLRHAGFGAIFGIALCLQFSITFLLLLPAYEAGRLSLGDLVLFNALLLQLNRPFEMIGQAIDDVVEARAHLAPMIAMWSAPAEDDPAGSVPLAITQGRIAFDGVGFVYENGRGVRGASFTAERGRVTFLTGETGAGKSTLLRLALKSILPQEGRILVDGVDLAAIRRADWASRTAVVPQEVMLLNESLEANILLGRPKDARRLRRVAENAAILGLIESLPEDFDTRVGERGLKLSGGERQRIAIARALYGDPAILFLDEASSALDEATEGDILAHLRALMGEVTIIAITHRKGVIAEGDLVVELRG